MARKRSPGEGTIYFSKTQNLWVSQITLPNGKRKTKYDKSQKVVQAWLLTQRTALRQGLLVEEDKMTYGDFLSRYFNDVATHTLRPKSLESYESLIRMHIQPEIGMIRLSALNPVHLQNLYSSKLNQGLSRRTVHYIHAIIHRSLNQALKWGLIYRNVADLAESPKVERKIPQTLSAEEVKKFLLVVKEDRLYPLYLLAVTTGMREGELLALDFESVDFFKNTIHVKRSAHQLIGKGIVISEPKTEKSKRTIAVPEFVMDILYEHLEKSGRKGGLIWEFKAHLVEAGLPDIRFHDLRHTAATLLLTEGVHPKVVQEMLGHSQISLTLDTYSHTIPNMQTEAAEKMNTLLR
jgi:integrase